METYSGINKTSNGNELVLIKLNSTDILNLNTPLTLVQPLENNGFLGIDRIVWKIKFNTTPYNYINTGEIYFMIGNERIATLQADNLNCDRNCGATSNANLCKDFKCPFIEFNTDLKLVLSDPPPTVGDSYLYLDIYYYVENINFW